MRRFRFRLSKVLKLRAHRERAARRALAEEVSSLGALEEALVHVSDNLRVCHDGDRVGRTAGLARALAAGLAVRHRRLEIDIRSAEQRVEGVRALYHEARIDHVAVQKLRQRQRDDWQRDADAEMQREFDEIARTRYLLRQREEARS